MGNLKELCGDLYDKLTELEYQQFIKEEIPIITNKEKWLEQFGVKLKEDKDFFYLLFFNSEGFKIDNTGDIYSTKTDGFRGNIKEVTPEKLHGLMFL